MINPESYGKKQAFRELVGRRVRLARESGKISQTALAEKLGVASHQIISQIETGQRALSADEMFVLTELFGRPMDYFTDPYLVVDESLISFRARTDAPMLDEFERRMKDLVSAAIRFSELSGARASAFKQQLPLNTNTTAAWACEVGSRISDQLKLGSIPANKLRAKVEKLADAFAAGLLMPTKAIQARWAAKRASDEIHEWLIQHATELQISGQALYWRLVGESMLKGKAKDAVDLNRLSRSSDSVIKPRLFSESFVRAMHTVLEQGKVSVRKAADLVDLDVDDLDPLFAAYGLESPA